MFSNNLRPVMVKCYRHGGLPSVTHMIHCSNLSKHKERKSMPDIIEIKKGPDPQKQFIEIASPAEKMVQRFPLSVQPYLRLMRFHAPTGGLLLLWPGYFSLAFATQPMHYPEPKYLALFALGTILMRGVGCTINDLFDRRYDKHVKRTKDRPLARGDITVTKALMFLALESSLALSILLKFDTTSIILGLSSMGLVCIYPLAKKFTYWPQLVLGLTFNWGALLGWSVLTHGSIYLPGAIPLYLGCISWTLFYDTIYAHQDRKDDLSIGLKSTAIKFGDDTKKWLTIFSSSMMANLAIAGITTSQTWPYYVTLLLASQRLYSITKTLDINDPKSCEEKFKDNVPIGYLIFCGIVLSTMIKTKPHDDYGIVIKPEDIGLATSTSNDSSSDKKS